MVALVATDDIQQLLYSDSSCSYRDAVNSLRITQRRDEE